MPLIASFGDFGTNDFIEYWTAFRLFISQSNPYDPALMGQLQRPLGWSESTPLMMWNPPWLLLIMAPILMLDFPEAATAWLLANFALLGGIIYFCLDLLGFSTLSRTQKYLSIPLALTFFPLYISLAVGQLGVLLAFAFIGGVWSITKKKIFFGSLCLALWTVKIHLFAPIIVFLLFKSLRNPELWLFFAGGVGALVAMILATEYLHPGVTRDWLTAFSRLNTPSNVVIVQRWQSATLTGGIRLLFADGDLIPFWPSIYVPAVAMIGVALSTIHFGSKLSYLNGSILAALCSMTCGPFGWVFDFTILLPGYLISLLQPMSHVSQLPLGRRMALTTPALLVQLAGWCCLQFFRDHHLYMWLPPAIFLTTLASLPQPQTSWNLPLKLRRRVFHKR